MEILYLNDGTEVIGHILEDASGGMIFVYMDKLSLAAGYALMSDKNKTVRIIAESHGNRHVYEGFTVLSAISDEYGNCNAVLRRGNNA